MPATANDHDGQTSPIRTADIQLLSISVGIGEIRSNPAAADFCVVPGYEKTTLRVSLAPSEPECKVLNFSFTLHGKDNRFLAQTTLSEEKFRLFEHNEIRLDHTVLGLKQHLTVLNSPFRLELNITFQDNSVICATTDFHVKIEKIKLLLGSTDDVIYPLLQEPQISVDDESYSYHENRYKYALWQNSEFAIRNNNLIEELRLSLSKNSNIEYKCQDKIPIPDLTQENSPIILGLSGDCFLLQLSEMYDNTGFRSYRDLWTYKFEIDGPWDTGPMLPLYAQPVLKCSSAQDESIPACIFDPAAVQGAALHWVWDGGEVKTISSALPAKVQAALQAAYTADSDDAGKEPKILGNTPYDFGGQRPWCPLMSPPEPPTFDAPIMSDSMGQLYDLSVAISNTSALSPIKISSSGNAAETLLDMHGYSRVILFGSIISQDITRLHLRPTEPDSVDNAHITPALDSYEFWTHRTITVQPRLFREDKEFYQEPWSTEVKEQLDRLFNNAGVILKFSDIPKKEKNQHFKSSYMKALSAFFQFDPTNVNFYRGFMLSRKDYTENCFSSDSIDADLRKYGRAVYSHQLEGHTMCLSFNKFNVFYQDFLAFYAVYKVSREEVNQIIVNALDNKTYEETCQALAEEFEQRVAAEYLKAVMEEAPGLHSFSYDFLQNQNRNQKYTSYAIAPCRAIQLDACPACRAPMIATVFKLPNPAIGRMCACGYELRSLTAIALHMPGPLLDLVGNTEQFELKLQEYGLETYQNVAPPRDNMAETIAHEFGHSLFLPHAPFPSTKPPDGSSDELHQPDNTLCLMSYSKREANKDEYKHFCAICSLRLRGWSSGETLDSGNKFWKLERDTYKHHPEMLEYLITRQWRRNQEYSQGTHRGFHQPYNDSLPGTTP